MDIVALTLVAAYGAVNLALAVAARDWPGIAGLFAAAGAALAVAAATGSAVSLVVGLLLGSAAPIAYGRFVRGKVRASHHVFRAAAALAIALVWLLA